MTEQSICMSPKCGITIDGIVKKCPQCGGLMRTSASIRAFGWVSLVCAVAALLLIGSMGWTFTRGSFTGTSGEAAAFLGVFVFMILFCLLACADALVTVVTGRPNRRLRKALFVAVCLLVLGLLLFRVAWRVIGTIGTSGGSVPPSHAARTGPAPGAWPPGVPEPRPSGTPELRNSETPKLQNSGPP